MDQGAPPASQEVEIKFDLDGEALAPLNVLLTNLGGAAAVSQLEAAYYDTENHDLKTAGFTLRVRRGGEAIVQTVKSQGASLFGRGEWETALEGEAPDLEAAGRTPLGPTLASVEGLGRIFTSRVERHKRLLAYGGGQIEAVLDRGEIETGDGRRSPVFQLELELKAGAPELLFQLARTLSAQVPLNLSFQTKAGLGYGLLAAPRRAIKGGGSPVQDGMTAGEAFAAISGGALRQMVANQVLFRAARAPEALHQLRVAVRRLRSAMALFAPVIADDRHQSVAAELKWLGGQLDEARDLDVLAAETVAPTAAVLAAELDDEDMGLASLNKRLKHAQARAYDRAVKAMASRRGLALALLVAEWIETGAWRTDSALAAERDQPVVPFAAAAMTRLRRRLKRRGAGLARLSPPERHRARIAAKKLRYGAEFFAPLWPGKRALRFIKALRDLQASLGDLNDISVAARRARSLADGQSGFAAGLVVGRRSAQTPARLAEAVDHFDDLLDARRPWRSEESPGI